MVEKIINPGNHNQSDLPNVCDDKSPLLGPQNTDPAEPYCEDSPGKYGTQKEVPKILSWLDDAMHKKEGLGHHRLCDEQQSGQIVNDLNSPTKEVVHRYSKAIRSADEAMIDLFRNIIVLDEEGKAHPIPIVWGTQERAVAWILQENLRKDDSTVVDRIKLPMLAIHQSDIQWTQERYIYHKAIDYMRGLREDNKPGFTIKEGKYDRDTIFGRSWGIPVDISYNLFAWTLYIEDMNQILEQILLKFSPLAYINVRGVAQEVVVSIDSIANNIDFEPGDKQTRVVKYQFNLTAKSYIPQPLVRRKAVLSMNVDIQNSVECDKVTEILSRLEIAAEELKEC